MKNSISILFYIKKSKADASGNTNIYLRITVDGRRAEMSVRRKVPINKWNAETGVLMGQSNEAKVINEHLAAIRSKVYKIHNRFLDDGKHVSADRVLNSYLGLDNEKRMLLEVFEEHNSNVNSLIGKDFAHGTAERYRTAKKHVTDYIKLNYKSKDIPISDVNYRFISGLEYYLKSERNCSHNTTVKYITNFKKIIRIALANDWISKDPFLRWKAKMKIVDREYLTQEEIQDLLDINLRVSRLDQVRDIFIFCCFTGLAYADVKKLTHDDIVLGIDGEKWIETKRTKTNTKSNIPVLPTAIQILQKYAFSKDVSQNRLLPVLTNQKMNAYLKEIADLSGIKKNLTTHLARHTFATTVTLSNGVSIESVSKMLGHKSLRTTQHYAKILNRRVSDDMQMLRNKFRNENNFNSSSSQSQT